MILTTSSTIPGHAITESKGLVKGSTIRARHVGKDIVASLRTVIGGEIKEYTEMMAESREEAQQRMLERAEEMGANAITDIRFNHLHGHVQHVRDTGLRDCGYGCQKLNGQ